MFLFSGLESFKDVGTGVYLWMGVEERLAGLEDRIARLEDRVGALETMVARLEGRVEELSKRIDDLRNDVNHMFAGLESAIAELRRDFRWMLGILITMWVTIIIAILVT